MSGTLKYIGTTPTRAYPGDAGFDLYVNGDWTIEPGAFVDIDLGVKIALPHDKWAMLTGRSSTLRNRGLLVAQGIIDTGYVGPLFAGVWNLTPNPVKVAHGDRVAQLIMIDNATARTEIEQVAHLPTTERGAKGFGSSGN